MFCMYSLFSVVDLSKSSDPLLAPLTPLLFIPTIVGDEFYCS